MIIRSKAPLRLGLAGGGTDLSPYCDEHSGFILNATIDRYVTCTIEPTSDNRITLTAADIGQSAVYDNDLFLPLTGELDLHKGVYNRIVKDFLKQPLSFKLTTHSDAIPGSGLGGSSTLVVAILTAFAEWLKLPLGEYDIARLAWEIERVDVGLSGGKQDQYAATFGGFNFMEFYRDRVIVNPLRVKDWIVSELECSMLICFTGLSRSSAAIIDEQIRNAREHRTDALAVMHQLKRDAAQMKEALLTGNTARFAEVLDATWHVKKKMAGSISNPRLEQIYAAAMAAGATAGKVSGAGGGGFLMFMIDPTRRAKVTASLKEFGGVVEPFHFVTQGALAWTV
jgi:D-glycero-alpha-D-manno-heptose-7-phosphate kinase